MITEELFNKLYEEILNKYKVFKKAGLNYTYKEIKKYWNEFNLINRQKDQILNRNVDAVNLGELYSICFGILSLSIGDINSNTNIRMLCRGFFTIIANTTFSILKLALDGFDYQSNVLIRNLYELCFALLNIIIDKNKRIDLFDSIKNENEYEIWRKHFTIKKMNLTIKEYEDVHEEGDESFINSWRLKKYKEYSSFAHNNLSAVIFYAYGLKNDDEDLLSINLWGNSAIRAENIICCMNDILWYTTKSFYKLLLDERIDINKEMLFGGDKDLFNIASFLHLLADEYCFLIKTNDETL